MNQELDISFFKKISASSKSEIRKSDSYKTAYLLPEFIGVMNVDDEIDSEILREKKALIFSLILKVKNLKSESLSIKDLFYRVGDNFFKDGENTPVRNLIKKITANEQTKEQFHKNMSKLIQYFNHNNLDVSIKEIEDTVNVFIETKENLDSLPFEQRFSLISSESFFRGTQ